MVMPFCTHWTWQKQCCHFCCFAYFKKTFFLTCFKTIKKVEISFRLFEVSCQKSTKIPVLEKLILIFLRIKSLIVVQLFMVFIVFIEGAIFSREFLSNISQIWLSVLCLLPHISKRQETKKVLLSGQCTFGFSCWQKSSQSKRNTCK